MPSLYKNIPTSPPTSYRDIFAAAPGLSAMQSLFEGVHDTVFCVKNHRRQYVAVNSAFVVRARVANKQALLGRTAREVFPPLLAAGYEQQDDLVFNSGREVRDKLEMVTNPDGRTGWYLAQKVPVLDTRGNIIALAGASCDLRSPADRDPRLAALAGAIDRIQNEFGKPLRIHQLARAAKMSLSQFERRLRSVLRVSPRQLLTQTRVDAAARMLRETNSTLQSVAVDCGFYDQALFSRQFKMLTGFTPGQYRAAARMSVL